MHMQILVRDTLGTSESGPEHPVILATFPSVAAKYTPTFPRRVIGWCRSSRILCLLLSRRSRRVSAAGVAMAQRRRVLADNALLARMEARRRRACSACACAACTSSLSCASHQRVAPPPSTAPAGHIPFGLLAAQSTQGMRTLHAVRLATNTNGVVEVCVRSLGEPRGRC
jgi:hypothetical protein